MTVNETKEWWGWLKTFPIERLIIFALIGLVVFFLFNPEKLLVWKGMIQSLFICSKKAQKGSIKNRVAGAIKYATRKMPEAEKELFPEGIRIEWKDGENETRESFLKGSQVIVRLNRTDNMDKIISIAAIEMAKTAVLTNGKRYMKTELSNASDYMMARKLVSAVNHGQSLSYFDEELFRPLYDCNADFKNYFDRLLITDRNGMYVTVFLNEVRKMAESLFPEPANDAMAAEVVEFLYFLCELCQRSDNLKFRYTGNLIRVDVAFTGDTFVLRKKGYPFYIKKCFDALESGVNAVYIFALGMKRIDAIGVEEGFNNEYPGYAITKRISYTHVFIDRRKGNGICIEFRRTPE